MEVLTDLWLNHVFENITKDASSFSSTIGWGLTGFVLFKAIKTLEDLLDLIKSVKESTKEALHIANQNNRILAILEDRLGRTKGLE